MHEPLVSVIMSVYNDEKYVAEAIESVLRQSFTDFEFLVIDDGSNDNSLRIISKFASQDRRIRLIINKCNVGLTKSLNIGIKAARGVYIARQDADDRSSRERFKEQVEELEKDDSLGIVGASAQKIRADGSTGRVFYVPDTPGLVSWESLFRNPFVHSSVMIRADALSHGKMRYNEELRYAQDYELWSKILRHYRGKNIKKPLVQYRVHEEQISNEKFAAQQEVADRVGRTNLQTLGIKLQLPDVRCLRLMHAHCLNKQENSPANIVSIFCRSLFLFAKSKKADCWELRNIACQAWWCLVVSRQVPLQKLLRPGNLLWLLRILCFIAGAQMQCLIGSRFLHQEAI